jgi:hypothetical protein
MALNTQLSDAAANAGVAAVGATVNGGSIKLYSGTQPANGNLGATGTLLVTLPLNNPAFGAAAAGAIALNTAGVSGAGVAAGTVGYAVFTDSGGNIKWMCSAGVSASVPNLVLSTTTISVGLTVSVTSYTLTLQEAGS